MNYYLSLPKNIDNLIARLKAEATSDGYTAIVTKLDALEKTQWYNLPHKLNKLVDVITDYQLLLVDGDLQDLLDEVKTIYWFSYLTKVNKLVEITELIESI